MQRTQNDVSERTKKKKKRKIHKMKILDKKIQLHLNLCQLNK